MNQTSALIALLPAAILLTACGGGGDDGSSSTAASLSDSTAQAMSANSTVTLEDGAAASDAIASTTLLVVAGGSASQTINCAGGGTATYTVTGSGTLASLSNGQLDAGESYALTFNACRGSSGAAQLDGTASLVVTSASSSHLVVQTSSSALAVTLPQRTLTLNGSSTLTRDVASDSSSGTAVVTTTTRWVSPQITLSSVRNSRTNTFALSDVDVTRSVTTTGGSVTARSSTGSYTMNATLASGVSWSIGVSTGSAVAFDGNGAPTSGSWAITLPSNAIAVVATPGTVTITIDRGANGSIDSSLTVTHAALAGEAG